MFARLRPQGGQSTVEWAGLLLLVGLAVAAAVALARVPGAGLARALADAFVCAVRLGGCERDPLAGAYGSGLARLVREHAPNLAYEDGMTALPVDYRSCRRNSCAHGADSGVVSESLAGEPVTAFVRVVDCRPPHACAGERDGSLYIQYWLYYPDSATLRHVPVAGKRGYHADDWESVQVRIAPDGSVDARASSHHGYNYAKGAANWASDAGLGIVNDAVELAGLRSRGGWGPATGWLLVSGGSHAGNITAGGPDDPDRVTPGSKLTLVPLETLVRRDRARFAVTPPWQKAAWSDPETDSTG